MKNTENNKDSDSIVDRIIITKILSGIINFLLSVFKLLIPDGSIDDIVPPPPINIPRPKPKPKPDRKPWFPFIDRIINR